MACSAPHFTKRWKRYKMDEMDAITRDILERMNKFSNHYILDKDGQPVLEPNVIAWGQWMEKSHNDGSRQIAFTKFSDGSSLSTVFLAMNHNICGDVPVLFESIVFGGFYNLECCRYTDRETAVKCHEAAAKRIQETIERKPLEPPALSCF